MAKREKEPDREHRIVMDIVVDAHDDEERGMSWYYYLQEQFIEMVPTQFFERVDVTW